MSLWMLILLLSAAIKLPIAALLLWLPFRYDPAMQALEHEDSDGGDGGSRRPPQPASPRPGGPLQGDRFPRRMRDCDHPAGQRLTRRRGAHAPRLPASPPRVRRPAPGRRTHTHR